MARSHQWLIDLTPGDAELHAALASDSCAVQQAADHAALEWHAIARLSMGSGDSQFQMHSPVKIPSREAAVLAWRTNIIAAAHPH